MHFNTYSSASWIFYKAHIIAVILGRQERLKNKLQKSQMFLGVTVENKADRHEAELTLLTSIFDDNQNDRSFGTVKFHNYLQHSHAWCLIHIKYYTHLTAFFNRTNRVSHYQKERNILDFTEARDDGVAVASAGPHANYLYFTPDSTSSSTSSLDFFYKAHIIVSDTSIPKSQL